MAHNRHYTKTFRFNDELGAFMDAEAKRQNRSVNNLIETMIMKSIEYKYRDDRNVNAVNNISKVVSGQ